MCKSFTFLVIFAILAITHGFGQDRPSGHAQQHHTVVTLMKDGRPTVRGLPRYEVVSGDPEGEGAPFVIRLHNYDNQVVPPHWHPGDEHIVVVKGTWYLAAGDKWDRSALRELNVGDYIFVPKGMRHFGISKGETVVQIHGVGPFKINLVGGWVYLSDAKAAASFKFKQGQTVRSARGPGVVRWGVHSAEQKITQYAVEKPGGDVFFEFEEELEPSTRPPRK